ncbi:bck1-like resistance to osmotic shock, partial [Serendipita sp. 398]
IEERLGRLNKISRERNEILKDLKEKVQNDDVSHVLLLNRRNAGVEPSLFATELEKFRPYQSRLAATTHAQQTTIQEIAHMWKSLKDKGGKNKGAKKWEERERRVMALVKRFASAREGYLEVSDGLMKGLQFYKDLTTLAKTLQERASAFLSARNRERESLSGRLEIEHRLESLPSPNSTTSSSGPPPALPPPPPRPLESHFGSMKISSPPPPQTQVQTPNAWQQHQPQHSHQRGPSLSAGTLPTSVYPQQSPGISPYGQPSPVTSSYLPASAPPAAAAAPPPPPQHSFSSSPYGQPQRQGTLSLPLSPPPPPPPSTVTSPPAAAPMSDPYAGLSSHFTLGGPSPPPQPQPQPPQQQYQSYGTPSYQPNQPQQQQQSVYGQHPTAPTYGTAQGYSAYQPSPTQSPPPPQHQHQQHQQQPSYGSQMGYASHGYGTQPMGGGYSTTGGYGSPAYLPPQQQQQQGQPPTAPAPYTASAFPPPPPQHTSSYQYPR